MRDKDNFNEEYERGRGYGRGNRQLSPQERYQREDYPREGYREGYRSREGYYPPSTREGYGDDRYETFDRFSGREPESRYEPRYKEPLYEPRYGQTDYSDRSGTQFSREGYEGRRQEGRSQIRCRDIMTRDVVACRRDSNIREV